jgi:8-oxo-dGTP diphosphatase
MLLKIPVCYIILRENRILLVKRSAKDNSEPNKWSFPGGSSLDTETFEETLKRELKEEINCDPVSFKYFKSYCIVEKEKIYKAIYFYGDIQGEIKLNEELSDFNWFNLKDNQTFDLDFAYNQKQILKDFLEHIK